MPKSKYVNIFTLISAFFLPVKRFKFVITHPALRGIYKSSQSVHIKLYFLWITVSDKATWRQDNVRVFGYQLAKTLFSFPKQ